MLSAVRNQNKIIEIPLVQIRPCRTQARRIFKQDDLKELAESIKQNGILQPLTVRKISVIEYELISGERRLRAAAMCGKTKVPCYVIICNDTQAGLYSLVENLQRKDLNVFEEAEGINTVMNVYGLTQEETARRLGKKQSTVANKLRVLKLSQDEREWIIKANLTERHARALLRIEDTVTRKIILSEIIERNMNVSQSEKYIEAALNEKNIHKRKTQKKRVVIKDIKIFENTINKAVNTMRSSGIDAISNQNETDDFIEYTVRISKCNINSNDNSGNLTA